MAFDPDAYLAKRVAFDPDSYLKRKEMEPSVPGVIARHGAQGLTFGFADEGMAALEAPFSAKTYQELRDAKRQQLDIDREMYPKTAIASEIGGAVLPAVAAEVFSGGTATPAVAARGMSLAKIAKPLLNPTTWKGMAGVGAAYGLGASEADLTKGDVGGAAWDTTKGAVTGGVLGKVVPAAAEMGGKALSATGRFLGDESELIASKAVGLTKPFKNKFKISPEKARETGRIALDEGIIGPMSDAHDMQMVVDELNNKIGPEIGKMLEDAQKRGITPDFNGMIERLEAEAAPYGKTEIGRGIYNQYQKIVRDLKGMQGAPKFVQPTEEAGINMLGVTGPEKLPTVIPGTPSSINELAQYKNVVGSVAYPKGAAPKLSNEGAIAGYGEVSRGLENVLDEGVPEGPFKPVYQELKRKYGAGSRMKMSLEKLAQTEDDTSILRPIDYARKKAEKYIHPIAAITMDKVSKILQTMPNAFGAHTRVLQQAIQRGGTSFATTNFLLQQRDPEYRKKMEELSNMKQSDEE
jgi:hypothetical protein